MKRIIINADDFGMNEEVNEGIKQGIEAGMITSVSVMVNMPYFKDAIRYLKKHPHVSVGLHFNITEGTALLPRKKTTTLLREDGHFFHWTLMVFNLIFGQTSLKEIQLELFAQYKMLQRQNVTITHIDSHHHIHLYPTLFRMITHFGQKNNIRALRCRTFNPRSFPLWIKNPPTLKQFSIQTLCLLDNLFINPKHFYEVNDLYDIAWRHPMTTEIFINYLKSIPEGTTEIICHPAVLSKTGNEIFLKPRNQGLLLLLNKKIKEVMETNNLRLVSREK